MEIAIWGLHSSVNYTGGRLHAWTIAEALTNNGHNVDYYTNTKPVFYNDFSSYKNHKVINLIINPFFIFYRKRAYDIIIIIPHRLSSKSFLVDRYIFYNGIKRQKKLNSNTKTIFLDFESPNWINEVQSNRRYSRYKYSNRIIKEVDVILSTTKIGSLYAKKYYSKFNSNLKYEQLYLSINDFIADKWIDEEKKNRVIFFGRFNLKYKNPESILCIIRSLPEEFVLSIIGNKSQVGKKLLHDIYKVSKDYKIHIEFYNKINDNEKFKLLAQSKILFFSSKFEGYGIPPIEAQYVNTSVICNDIPVLREINKNAIFDDFSNPEILQKKIQDTLKIKYSKNELHESVVSFAKFEIFAKNLENIIMRI